MSQLPAAAWLCPACQSYHAPHVDTCPRPFSNQQGARAASRPAGDSDRVGHFLDWAETTGEANARLARAAYDNSSIKNVVPEQRTNGNIPLDVEGRLLPR
jgi:hypothetical protein